MRRAYCILLRLYPREYRRLFGKEMLSVFTRMAEERRVQPWWPYARFLFNEFIGLLSGACGERLRRVNPAPFAAIALAALLHAAFYVAAGTVLRRVTTAADRLPLSDPRAAALMVGVLAVASLLCLLPIFFMLSIRLMHRRR
jgi:hypothetical protein